MKVNRRNVYQFLIAVGALGSVGFNRMPTRPASRTERDGVATTTTEFAIDREFSLTRKILWGIRSTPEKEEFQSVIRSTYLNTSIACSYASFDATRKTKSASSCRFFYMFLVTNPRIKTPIWHDNDILQVPSSTDSSTLSLCQFEWFHYAASTILSRDHGAFEHVVWVDSTSLVNLSLVSQFIDHKASKNNTSSHHLYSETPEVDCGQYPRLPEKKACQKMSGSLILLSRSLAQKLPSCDVQTNLGRTFKDHIRHCLAKDIAIDVLVFPRQHARKDVNSYQTFWKKLQVWNSFPYRVIYVTAKFGRPPPLKNFTHQVAWKHTALLSHGWNPDHIFAYDSFPTWIIDDPRWQPHLAHLYNASLSSKGAGYWFWKAPLLLHHLEHISWNDFVIYADVDLRDHLRWMGNLLQTMVDHSTTSLAVYQVDYLERSYNKADAYRSYCPTQNQSHDTSFQYAGGWLVLRKTMTTMQLIRDWQDGLSNYHLLNDEPSIQPNIREFRYHLHDQAILSVLLKCRYNLTRPSVIFQGADTLKEWKVHLFSI